MEKNLNKMRQSRWRKKLASFYVSFWRFKILIVVFTLESAESVNLITDLALTEKCSSLHRKLGIGLSAVYLIMGAISSLVVGDRIERISSSSVSSEDFRTNLSMNALRIARPLFLCAFFTVISLAFLALVAAWD